VQTDANSGTMIGQYRLGTRRR